MAQYFNQPVLRWHQWVESTPNAINDLRTPMSVDGVDKGWYLLLRDVSQLTDEEKEVVKTILSKKEKPNPTDIEIGEYCTFYYSYLRLIGICLPFTYLSENNTPVTLQPDELVAKGWVKLYS